MLKIVRRYLFSLSLLVLSILSVFGWWHSTREWMAWVAETPFGIFKIQSESSIFGIGGQFMQHEHRWAAFSNSDSITGDSMKWLVQPPKFQFGDGLILMILPYWQLLVTFAVAGGLIYLVERKKVRAFRENCEEAKS